MRDYSKEFKDSFRKMEERLEKEKDQTEKMKEKGRKFAREYYKNHPEMFDRIFDEMISEMGKDGVESTFEISVPYKIGDKISIKDILVDDYLNAFRSELEFLIRKDLICSTWKTLKQAKIYVNIEDGNFIRGMSVVYDFQIKCKVVLI